MAKEKKHNVADIEKLRKILDNPYDPNVTHMLTTNDVAIDSVRQRLTHRRLVYRALPTRTTATVTLSLEPTVTIRPRIKHTTMTSPSPTVPLPEFEPVSTAPVEETPVFTPVAMEEPLFEDESLIEIEKVDLVTTEFTAVEPTTETIPWKDVTAPPEETASTETSADTNAELPRWQAISETPTYEPIVVEEKPPAEEIPEFTRLAPQSSEETSEQPMTEQPVRSETPILTKQQQRAQQKEAKRKRKMERKQARIEARRKKQEARQQQLEEQTQAQQSFQQQEPEALPVIPEQTQTDQHLETPPEEPVPEGEQPDIKVDLSAFKDIKSIDKRIGDLLYRNGYFSLDDLRKATIDDLVQIRGIKRKLAKNIKKEIEQQQKEPSKEEFITYNKKPKPKKAKVRHEDVTEWESFSIVNNEDNKTSPPATHRKYTLYQREQGKGAKKTTVHFFSKEKPTKGTPVPLPRGYEIAVHKKTKVPYLKKKK
jgi:hypothetical protein